MEVRLSRATFVFRHVVYQVDGVEGDIEFVELDDSTIVSVRFEGDYPKHAARDGVSRVQTVPSGKPVLRATPVC